MRQPCRENQNPCHQVISIHLSDVVNVRNGIDENVLERFTFGPTFHRNDSFNKAVNGEEEEEDNESDKKSVDYLFLT